MLLVQEGGPVILSPRASCGDIVEGPPQFFRFLKRDVGLLWVVIDWSKRCKLIMNSI